MSHGRRHKRLTLFATLVGIGIVVVVAADFLKTLTRPPVQTAGPEQPESEVGGLVTTSQPYPLTDADPTATPTPTQYANGSLPPPGGVATDSLKISESEFAVALRAISDALDAEDSRALAGYIRPQGISVAGPEGGLAILEARNAAPAFEELFQKGSGPTLQGYFDYG